MESALGLALTGCQASWGRQSCPQTVTVESGKAAAGETTYGYSEEGLDPVWECVSVKNSLTEEAT